MKVYLDTKDLIGILERGDPCSYEVFADALRGGEHELVLSFVSVMELSAPLLYTGARTNVARILNRLERLPVTYIARVYESELHEAHNAFCDNREYLPVAPFVHRFDYTVHRLPPTRMYLSYPLSHAVFDLWQTTPELFAGFADWQAVARAVVCADRELCEKPSLRHTFVEVIGRRTRSHGVRVPPGDLEAFANWVYDCGDRCPGIRLAYEAHHRFLGNTGDTLKNGDIGDHHHITSTPYVDLISLDRRARTYALQACRAAGLRYEARIPDDVGQLVRTLG